MGAVSMPSGRLNDGSAHSHVGADAMTTGATRRAGGIAKTLQMILGRKFDKTLIHFPSALEPRRQHPCHSPEQMQKIVDAVREPYKTLFAVFTETGLRSGEAYGLRVEDVDLQRLLIHVRRSVRGGKVQSPKSLKAYRTIDIQIGLGEMIKKHLNGLRCPETASVSEPGIQDPKVAHEDERHRHGEPAGAEQSDLVEETALNRRRAFVGV